MRLLLALSLVLWPALASAQDFNTLTGTIAGFECGDNCYLTVDLGDAGQLTALCVAPECDAWNENVAIPEELIGASVTVVVGGGGQFTGGEDLEPFVAFTTVTIKS
jgi:hypothetical protein